MLFSSLNKSSKSTANKYGLSTPPCLTPLDTWNGSEKCLPHLICINCSLYQCFSRCTKHIGTLLWISFSNNFMCSTRSNAFEASKNTACTDEPWVTKYEADCFNKNVHWSGLWPALKPNWLSVVPKKGEIIDTSFFGNTKRLCLFCLMRQKHCWNYFAFNQSYLAKAK